MNIDPSSRFRLVEDDSDGEELISAPSDEVRVITQPSAEAIRKQKNVDDDDEEASIDLPVDLPAVADESVTVAQATTAPAFREARDSSDQRNDALVVRRHGQHGQQLATLNGRTHQVLVDIADKQPPSDFATRTNGPAVFEPPRDALLLLERVSPLVSNTFTIFEHGDGKGYGFSDTFGFERDSSSDAASYQHSFAFTAGRYEIAPPSSALHRANILPAGNNGPDNFETLPTLFHEAIDDRVSYPMLASRATKFSQQVLSLTLEQARHDAQTSKDVLNEVGLIAKATARNTDDAQLLDIDDDKALRLRHIRYLDEYEEFLLERNGMLRVRVSGDRSEDGPFIVNDRLREYRVEEEGECDDTYETLIETNDLDDRLPQRIVYWHLGQPRPSLPRSYYKRTEVKETLAAGTKAPDAGEPPTVDVLRERREFVSTRERERRAALERLRAARAARGPEEAAPQQQADQPEVRRRRTDDVDVMFSTVRNANGVEEDEEGSNEDEDELGLLPGEGVARDEEEQAEGEDIDEDAALRVEEGFTTLNLDDRVYIGSPTVLDERYTQTAIVVPLGWSALEAIRTVSAGYQDAAFDETGRWWSANPDTWRAIVELAIYEKLVPCYGDAFPEEARHLLGVTLELIWRRVNVENTFLAANRDNFRAYSTERASIEKRLATLLRQRANAARDSAELDESIARYRRQLASLKVPIDALPALLRICVPGGNLLSDISEAVDPETEALAHIYATAGYQMTSAANPYRAARINATPEDCGSSEAENYPLSGYTERLPEMLNDHPEYLAAVLQYVGGSAAALNVASASVLGTQLEQYYRRQRDDERRALQTVALSRVERRHLVRGAAARQLAEALFPAIPVRERNQLKTVFVVPPNFGTLAARRSAVGPLFDDVFDDLGQFDLAGLAEAMGNAKKLIENRAAMIETRGSERLYCNAAQLHANEYSAPSQLVFDQTPRVHTNFALDASHPRLPEGVYRVLRGTVVVDREATVALLNSRSSIGGRRVHVSSVPIGGLLVSVQQSTAAFYFLTSPAVTRRVFERAANDSHIVPETEASLRRFLTYMDTHSLETLGDYHAYRLALQHLDEELNNAGVRAAVSLIDEQSTDEFVAAAATSLSQQNTLFIVSTLETSPERLVTLPLDGMAALERTRDPTRIVLRQRIWQCIYELSVQLRFKRLGYINVPFNTSHMLPMLLGAENYTTHQTTLLAIDNVLGPEEDEDEEEEDEESSAADRPSGQAELRTLRVALKRDVETIHIGRTLWFELSTLYAQPDAYASLVATHLVELYDTISQLGRRVALDDLLEARGEDGTQPPLPLDPRAQTLVDVYWQASEEIGGEDAAEQEENQRAIAALHPLLAAVQDAADDGSPIEELLSTRAIIAPQVAAPQRRAPTAFDLLAEQIEGPSAAAQPVAAQPSAVAQRARALLERLEAAGRSKKRDRDVEEKMDELRASLRRRPPMAAVAQQSSILPPPRAEGQDSPLASHKTATIRGVESAARVARDYGILNTAQQRIMNQIGGITPRMVVETMRDTIDALLGGSNRRRQRRPTGTAKQRLLPTSANPLARAELDYRLKEIVSKYLSQRAEAITAMGRVRRRTVSLEAQTNVALFILTRDTVPGLLLNRAPVSRIDLVAMTALIVDLERILAYLDARELVGRDTTSFHVSIGAMSIERTVPTYFVRLLLPAAQERARLDLQQQLEKGELATVRPRTKPYAVANRADAHQALRVDELVMRYAFGGEVPLEKDNDAATPYGQYGRARSLGRLATEREEAFAALKPVEQRVAFNEGQHRTFASGIDMQLSALMTHLLNAFGAIRKLPTLAAAYRASFATVSETRRNAHDPMPLARLMTHIYMFFNGEFPALEEMRPLDMRLLALALLGYDVAPRLDANIDDDRDDTPEMSNDYVHLRANAAKRVLADAYYRALLEQLPRGDRTLREVTDLYERRLLTAALRADTAVTVDRVPLLDEAHTLAEQIESLSVGRARTVATNALSVALNETMAIQPLDQPWLLVPRIALIGGIVRVGGLSILRDALEKILLVLDDSAHLLALDTEIEASDIVARLTAPDPEPPKMELDDVQPTEIVVETTTLPPPTSPAQAAVIPRNPTSAKGTFPTWLAGVNTSLKTLLGAPDASLRGPASPVLAKMPLLQYELEALYEDRETPDSFYQRLERSLEAARRLVSTVFDAKNDEVLRAAPSDASLQAALDQAQLGLDEGQRQLALLVTRAELERRTIWRPTLDGSALQNKSTKRLSEQLRVPPNSPWTVLVFDALREAFVDNKRSIKTIFTEYIEVHKQLDPSTFQPIERRMLQALAAFIDAQGKKPFAAQFAERYLSLYDAIELLLRANNKTVTAAQLHPLLPLLAAPLSQRTTLRLRTERYNDTASVLKLVSVFPRRFGSADDDAPLSSAFVMHEFRFAEPAAAEGDDGNAGASKQRRLYNYDTVGRVTTQSSRTLNTVLAEANTMSSNRVELSLLPMPSRLS